MSSTRAVHRLPSTRTWCQTRSRWSSNRCKEHLRRRTQHMSLSRGTPWWDRALSSIIRSMAVRVSDHTWAKVFLEASCQIHSRGNFLKWRSPRCHMSISRQVPGLMLTSSLRCRANRIASSTSRPRTCTHTIRTGCKRPITCDPIAPLFPQ